MWIYIYIYIYAHVYVYVYVCVWVYIQNESPMFVDILVESIHKHSTGTVKKNDPKSLDPIEDSVDDPLVRSSSLPTSGNVFVPLG